MCAVGVSSWHKHLSGLPFYDSLQTAWKEMKRFIGFREESGQERAWGGWGSCRAQVPLWYLRTCGFFARQVKCVVCILCLPLSLSPFLSLSLWEPYLCILLGICCLLFLCFWGTCSQPLYLPNVISNRGSLCVALRFCSPFWKVEEGWEWYCHLCANPLPSSCCCCCC